MWVGEGDDNQWERRGVYGGGALQARANDIRAPGLVQLPIGCVLQRKPAAMGVVLDPEDTDVLQAVMFPKSLVTSLGRFKGADVRVQLAFGHRRLRAIRLIAEQDGALETAVMPVDLRPLSDEEMAEFAWSENAKRRDLSPIEAAQAIERMVKDFRWTQEEVAHKLGVSRPTVSNRLRLLKLPEDVQARVRAGEVSERQAMALVPLYDLPKAIRAEMEKVAWGGGKPSEVVAHAGTLSSDAIRDYISRGVGQATFSVNGQGWAQARLEGEGIVHPTCEGCAERIKVRLSDGRDEWRCARNGCSKAREAAWAQSQLAAATAVSGIPLLEEAEGYQTWTSLDGAPEPAKIIEERCPNLRLKWEKWSSASQVHVDGYPNVRIVCRHGEGGKCACATKAKAAQTRAANAALPADDPEREARELKRRVEREVLDPAAEAVLEALLAGELGVWRTLANKANYQARIGDDWPLERIQRKIAEGLVVSYELGFQNSFDAKRSTVEGTLSNLGVRAPWKLSPAEALERKLARLATWLRTVTRDVMWSMRDRLTAEAVAGNLVNLADLGVEVAALADVDEATRARLDGEIVRLTEVLLRVQAILPEVLTCPWGSRERKATLLRLVEEAEPKSLLFDTALRDADELTLRYALALAVGDELREAELTRRLAEVSAGADPEVKA